MTQQEIVDCLKELASDENPHLDEEEKETLEESVEIIKKQLWKSPRRGLR